MFKKILQSILIIVICINLVACETDVNNQYLSATALETLFGIEKNEVLSKLKIDVSTDIQKTEIEDSQETMLLKSQFVFKKKSADVQLLFYNNIFFGVTYLFTDALETSYNYTKSLFKSFEKVYGSADTYPTMPNRIVNLELEQFKNSGPETWNEIWEMKDKDDLIKKMMPDYQGKAKLNLDIRLYHMSTEQKSVTTLTALYHIQKKQPFSE